MAVTQWGKEVSEWGGLVPVSREATDPDVMTQQAAESNRAALQLAAQLKQLGATSPMTSPEQGKMFKQGLSEQYRGLSSLVGQMYGDEGLGGALRDYDDLIAEYKSPGTSQRAADIRQAYQEKGSDIQQGLARQGMAGTTVAPTMGLGVEREKQSALNRLSELMGDQRLSALGAREGMLGSILGTIGQPAQTTEQASAMGALASALSGGKLKLPKTIEGKDITAQIDEPQSYGGDASRLRNYFR